MSVIICVRNSSLRTQSWIDSAAPARCGEFRAYGAGGALIGGTSGAFSASNADLYNRSQCNNNGTCSTASQVLDWIGDQFDSAGRGAVNLAGIINHKLNSIIPSSAGQKPDADASPLGDVTNSNHTPPTGGAVVTTGPVAIPTPGGIVLVPGMPGYVPSTTTLSSGSGDSNTDAGRGQSTSGASGDSAKVWNLEPTDRGVKIESQLAKTDYSPANGWYQVGAENNGYFDLVDFQKGNTLVSLKTVDTTGSTWLPRMEGAIDKLGSSGATVNGNPANLVLDIRVQPGGSGAAQQLISYGASRGVTVRIKVYP